MLRIRRTLDWNWLSMEAGGMGPGFPLCTFFLHALVANASSLPNDILAGPLMVKDDVNAEEGVHQELGMELPDQRICVIYRETMQKSMIL